MAPTAGYAAQALALRRRAIRLLAAEAPGDLDPPTDVPESVWQLFLRIEQCAAALKARLDRGGVRSAVLDRFATDDVQRSLGARAQLRKIADIARPQGWTIVVLKGSVAAADGRSHHLQDVDILVQPGDAAKIGREIAGALGMTPEGKTKSRHLPTMGGKFSVPIEVHLNIDTRGTTPLTRTAWSRIVPLASMPGLFRLAPRDHCLHLLSHIVIDHPDRRGRLRDALVLRDAVAGCSPEEVDQIHQAVRLDPYGTTLLAELRFAQELMEGVADDAFERAAFTSYWLAEKSLPWSREKWPFLDHVYGTVWQGALTMAAGWPLNPWLRDALLEPPADRSELSVISFLERRVPPLGRAVRLAVRMLHYATALVAAWPLARFAARAAEKAGARTAS